MPPTLHAARRMPRPPCGLDAADPGPLREQACGVLSSVVARPEERGPSLFAFREEDTLVVSLPVRPLPDAELGRMWGTLARAEGVRRCMRLGVAELTFLDRPTTACWVVMEAPIGGAPAWVAWVPVDIVPSAAGAVPVEHSDAEPRPPGVDELIARWTKAYDEGTPDLKVALATVPPTPPPSGSPVILEAAPVTALPPADIDGLLRWFDVGIIQWQGLLQSAVHEPPVVLVLRGKLFERWRFRVAQRASLDDIVRNVACLGETPTAVCVLQMGATVFQGREVRSIRCVVETRKWRVVRHIPMVLERAEGSDPWIEESRRRTRRGQEWIGARPTVDLAIHPDGWPFRGPVAEG